MRCPGGKQVALFGGDLQILCWAEEASSEDAPATIALEPDTTATDPASILHDPSVCSGNHRRHGSGCIDQDRCGAGDDCEGHEKKIHQSNGDVASTEEHPLLQRKSYPRGGMGKNIGQRAGSRDMVDQARNRN